MVQLVRVVDRIVDLLSTVAGVLMTVMTAVVTASVISRYVFGSPLQATSETSGLLFAWLVFLAAISVTHNQDNIAVTYFRDKLPGKHTAARAEIAMKVGMVCFSVILTWSSILLTTSVMDQGMPVLQISTAWLNVSVAFAFGIVSVVLLLQVVTDLFFPHLRKPVGEPVDPTDPDAGQLGGAAQ